MTRLGELRGRVGGAGGRPVVVDEEHQPEPASIIWFGLICATIEPHRAT